MKQLKTIGLSALAVFSLSVVPLIGANATEDLPDLLILDKGEGLVTKLEWNGKCNSVQPYIIGDVVIKNAGTKRAKALAISPLISAYDLDDPSFKDDDVKLNSLAPGETQKARIRIGGLKKKSGMTGWRRIRIVADRKDKIDELNEKNNSYDVRVKVNCP